MSSVVLELQRDALDNNVHISDLLRKSLVVARKLKIDEFERWISSELNGYSESEEIPEYRWSTGLIKAWNPHHGWQPVLFPDDRIASTVSRRPNGQSISELENLHKNDDGSSIFEMPLPDSVQALIRKAIKFNTEIKLFFSSSDIVKILSSARNIVLNWAIKLEEEGILGENLSFTSQEKIAAKETEYHITNFYGPVENSQIQQHTTNSNQRISKTISDIQTISNFINEVREKVNQIDLKPVDRKELESELVSVEAQVKSPKPKTLIIKEGLKSIRSILEGAGGGVATSLLSKLFEMIF